jgi:hypothetical protein
MASVRPLSLEQLEDRTVLATFNVPWPDAPELTLSFAPDGTMVGGQPSALFQALDARLPTRTWEEEILRAFQTWAAAAHINVGVVADGGQPFGTLGLKQGDPRFGDIRIGAFPMAGDTLAIADPYDPFIANTSVGDVFLNSSFDFSLGGQNGSYDLFSVLLHEAGHVLGIGPSTDPNSPMFEQYHPVSGLTPADVAALRALYGARPPDTFEGPGGNDTFATATALDLTSGTASVGADVTTLQDADVYRLTVPAGAAALDLRLIASGVSLLVPRLTVYDVSGHVIASAAATGPLDNDLFLHVDGVKAGDVYYAKVESGTDDVFGIGSYRLEIDPHLPGAGARPVDLGVPPNTPAPPVGAGANPTNPLAGAQLLATTPGYVEHTYYEAVNSITPATPTHTYRVQSPDLGKDLTNVMTVVVNSLESTDVSLRANIYDARGTRVDAAVIADKDGHYALQVPGVRSAESFYVVVFADNPGSGAQEAPYEVDIDFGLDARHLQTFVNDTLDKTTREDVRVLQVVDSQQFQFVLSATDWSAPVATGVRMTIFDASGREVFNLAVTDGATRTGTVFLNAGRYTVKFTRATEQGEPFTPVLFELSGLSLSDSLGPQLRDTTQQPLEASAAAAVPAPSFFWLPAGPTDLLAGGGRNESQSLPLITALAAPRSDFTSGSFNPGTSRAEALIQALPSSTGAVAVPATGLPGSAAFLTGPGGIHGGVLPGLMGLPQAAGAGGTLRPSEATAVGEGIAPVVSDLVGDGVNATAPGEAHGPSRSGTFGETEAEAGTGARGGAADHLSVRSAALMTKPHLLWAVGVVAVAVGWLLLPAKYLVPRGWRRAGSLSLLALAGAPRKGERADRCLTHDAP